MTQRPSTPAGASHEAPDPLAKAIAEFNSWRFYDCHETLEEVWLEAGGKSARALGAPGGAPMADLYQGLIKAAAGFHHVLRDNHRGAVLVLVDALRLLAPYRPSALGIDTEGLTEAIQACLEQIQALGPERIREFDRGMIPQIMTAAPACRQAGIIADCC